MSRSILSRRTVLTGLGTALTLPLLPSLLGREARASATGAPRRMVHFVLNNGVDPATFTPSAVGTGFELPPGMASLEPWRNRLAVISGLQNAPHEDQNSAHASAMSTLLTDRPYQTPNGSYASVDQVVAATMTGVTPFQSVQTGAIETAPLNDPGSDYCSWTEGGIPLPNVTDPVHLFERLFGSPAELENPADLALMREVRGSVLDQVLGRVSDVNRRIAVNDRLLLDQYVTAVRDLETRLEMLETMVCEAPDIGSNSLGFIDGIEAISEIMAVALHCDLTRVITFQFGASGGYSVYPHLGLTSDHHTLSNDPSDPGYHAISAWQYEVVAGLVGRLAELQDGTGDVLSSTMITVVPELSHAGYHWADDLTALVIGGGVAGTAQGVHSRTAGAPVGRLLLNATQFMGLPANTFGANGTSPLIW
jgi:hypothetical protein